MKTQHLIETDQHGRIMWSMQFQTDGDHQIPARCGGVVRVVPAAAAPLNPTAHYWDGAGVVAIPPPPSDAHKFNYATKAWEPDTAQAWREVRLRRDGLLIASDWVRLRAADLGEPVPPEWLAYRQALRDITEQPDPLNIVWPTPPDA